MLNLTRYEGEEIIITAPGGTTIKIKVRDISAGRVMLSFDAPRQFVIMRSELLHCLRPKHKETES